MSEKPAVPNIDRPCTVRSDRRAAFEWFAVEPTWHESTIQGMAAAEAQAVTTFTQQLALDQPESNAELPGRSPSRSARLTSSASLRLYSAPSIRPSATLQPQVRSLHHHADLRLYRALSIFYSHLDSSDIR